MSSEDEISLEVGCDATVALELAETFTVAKPKPSSLAHATASSPPAKTSAEPNPDALTGGEGGAEKTIKDPPKKKTAKAKAAPKQAPRCCVTVCVALKLANHVTCIMLLTGR